METPDDEYLAIAWYHISEARRLFECLENEDVRFEFENPANLPQDLDTHTAVSGGGFGLGSQLLVYVHKDDQDKFHEIHHRLFDAPEKAVDWRQRLREG